MLKEALVLTVIVFTLQQLEINQLFTQLKKIIGSSRYLRFEGKTSKGKISYKYWKRTAYIEHIAKIIDKW